jgi:hypothetical protein
VEPADDGGAGGAGENSNLIFGNALTYDDASAISAEMMGRFPIDLAQTR